MTRDEQIALLRKAEQRICEEDDVDIVRSGAVFGAAASAMEGYPEHTPDGLDSLLYMAENVEDWITSAILIKAMAG